MNNADLQALADKREANIQKLNNYLNAGKTPEEKIVAKLITQIKNAEDKLSSAGVDLGEIINDDGTFTVLSKSENTTSTETIEPISTEEKNDNTIEVEETATENKTSEIKKTKSSKKVSPKRKLRDDSEESKPENVKIGVTVKESIKTKIDALADDNNMKANDVVNDLLGRVFDGKNFTVQFEKKEQTKITSFNISESMDKALIKLNKSTGIPKTELFNRLLEEALKDFFE
ncbi:hypothetical protein P5F11_15040 [Clostridium perfringens]|nr:hypothetical protein [Clostridium perfringens]